MDGHRFDELAKRFASRTSRRRVVKGLTGGIIAGVAGVLGGAEADAQRVTQAYCGNMVCADDPIACRDGCVCCVFGNGNSRCMPPKDCARLGGAPPPTTTTTTTPAPTTTTTTTRAPECPDGQVEIGGACYTPCTTNSECPCPGGVCSCVCQPIGDAGSFCLGFSNASYQTNPPLPITCTSNESCQAGEICTGDNGFNYCFIPCGPITCTDACPAPLVCVQGICGYGPCTDTCPDPLTCVEGNCQKVTALVQPPDVVWRALTDRSALSAWAMDNDFEPVVGHRFQLRAAPRAGFDGVMDGEVVAVEPGRTLSFTWRGGSLAEPTTVTLTLRPHGGGTRLLLRHSAPDDAPCLAASEILGRGWHAAYLKRALSRHLERG